MRLFSFGKLFCDFNISLSLLCMHRYTNFQNCVLIAWIIKTNKMIGQFWSLPVINIDLSLYLYLLKYLQ